MKAICGKCNGHRSYNKPLLIDPTDAQICDRCAGTGYEKLLSIGSFFRALIEGRM